MQGAGVQGECREGAGSADGVTLYEGREGAESSDVQAGNVHPPCKLLARALHPPWSVQGGCRKGRECREGSGRVQGGFREGAGRVQGGCREPLRSSAA